MQGWGLPEAQELPPSPSSQWQRHQKHNAYYLAARGVGETPGEVPGLQRGKYWPKSMGTSVVQDLPGQMLYVAPHGGGGGWVPGEVVRPQAQSCKGLGTSPKHTHRSPVTADALHPDPQGAPAAAEPTDCSPSPRGSPAQGPHRGAGSLSAAAGANGPSSLGSVPQATPHLPTSHDLYLQAPFPHGTWGLAQT